MPASKKSRKKTLFKAKFLHLRNWKKKIREFPDCTGNEPTPDIPRGGSGQDIKKNKWQIHAICENMLIMRHVPHLITDKEGK